MPTPPIKPTPPEDTSVPKPPQGNLVNFGAAVERVVEMGRQKRETAQAEFLSGKVKPGTVSASTFSGVLRNLSLGGRQFSERLADTTMNAAVKDFDIKFRQFEKDQDFIRELALLVGDNGAPSQVISNVAKAGTVNAAIEMANDHLQKKKTQVVNLGDNGAYFVVDNGDGTFSQQTIVPPSSGVGGGGIQIGDNIFDLTTAEGIRAYKAAKPDATRADIAALIDTNTKITTGNIDELLDSAGLAHFNIEPESFLKEFETKHSRSFTLDYFSTFEAVVPQEIISEFPENDKGELLFWNEMTDKEKKRVMKAEDIDVGDEFTPLIYSLFGSDKKTTAGRGVTMEEGEQQLFDIWKQRYIELIRLNMESPDVTELDIENVIVNNLKDIGLTDSTETGRLRGL